MREGKLWKIHLHAADVARRRARRWARWARWCAWSWDDLQEQMSASPPVAAEGEVHIVTDGAASLSRREAEALGVTLLDSHIDFGERSLPETRLDPDDVYRAMRRGVRVSTAQASTHERHMHYERLDGAVEAGALPVRGLGLHRQPRAWPRPGARRTRRASA